MAADQDVQKLIHRYARHIGKPRFSMQSLAEYSVKYARRYASDHPELEVLLGEKGREILRTNLDRMEHSGAIQVSRDEQSGAILSVFYSGFFDQEIQRWYDRMSEERDLSFPGESSLGVAIPPDMLQPVDVTENLMHWLETPEDDAPRLLLLRFPDNIEPMLITGTILRTTALPPVINKVREYLRTDKNAGFIEAKLRTFFPSREVLVHEEIETTQARPDDAIQSLTKPNDFQFHFWTQLSSLIIKEYAKKTDKLAMEHDFCRAAYILGYYAVYHKGLAQKENEREAARKLLLEGVRKPPYVFTVRDLHAIADDRGVPLEKKIPVQELNQWIEEMLTRPSDREISQLVSIDTPEQNGLVLHSAQYVPLLLRQVKAAAPVLKRQITDRFVSELSNNRKDPWIQEDEAFEHDLATRVKADFPLLFGLARFKTLFLVIDGQSLPEDQKKAALAMIQKKSGSMRPWTEILGIHREDVYRDARLQLPVWMIIPFVRGFVRLLQSMFSSQAGTSGRRKGSAPTTAETQQPSKSSTDDSGPSRTEKLKQFKASIAAMQQEYLTEDQTAEERLRNLSKSWNPLVEPVARENLIEDVNSLCRDTLRRMRSAKRLQPPTHESIRQQARRIAENRAFDRIKRRKEFQTYLELYMITILGRTK